MFFVLHTGADDMTVENLLPKAEDGEEDAAAQLARVGLVVGRQQRVKRFHIDACNGICAGLQGDYGLADRHDQSNAVATKASLVLEGLWVPRWACRDPQSEGVFPEF